MRARTPQARPAPTWSQASARSPGRQAENLSGAPSAAAPAPPRCSLQRSPRSRRGTPASRACTCFCVVHLSLSHDLLPLGFASIGMRPAVPLRAHSGLLKHAPGPPVQEHGMHCSPSDRARAANSSGNHCALKSGFPGPAGAARLNRRAGRVQAERDDVAERAVAGRRHHAPDADDAALRHAACARTRRQKVSVEARRRRCTFQSEDRSVCQPLQPARAAPYLLVLGCSWRCRA